MDLNKLFPAYETKYSLPDDSRVFVEVPGLMRWRKKPMMDMSDDGRRYYFLSVCLVDSNVNPLQPGSHGMTHFSYMACEDRLVIRQSQDESVIVFPCNDIQTACTLVQMYLLPGVRDIMPAYQPQEVAETCQL